jgi:hypothetical protein
MYSYQFYVQLYITTLTGLQPSMTIFATSLMEIGLVISCYAAKSYKLKNYNLCGAGILPALYIQIRRLIAYHNHVWCCNTYGELPCGNALSVACLSVSEYANAFKVIWGFCMGEGTRFREICLKSSCIT